MRQAITRQQREQGARSHEAELLADGREDEVRVLLGDDVESGLGAVERALPEDASGADGHLGLVEVVGRAAGRAVRVVLLEERRQAALLVGLEHPRVQDEERAADADHGDGDDVPEVGAADQQHAHADRDEHERGAEVGLQQDEGHRDAERAEDRDQAAEVELAVEVRDHRCQGDDHHDLGQLRRLQLEGTHLEPRLRALLLAPEPGDDEEQEEEHASVGQRGQLPVAPVVDHRGDRHDGRADGHEEELLGQEARVEVGWVAATCGAEDHQAPEGTHGRDAADEHDVDVAPRRGRVAREPAQGAGCERRTGGEGGGGGHQSRTSPGSGESSMFAAIWPPAGAGGSGTVPESTSNRRRATGAATAPP